MAVTPKERLAIAAHRVMWRAKTVVARYPAIAMPIARWRGHGECVGPDTEILVESFPRSASAFVTAALRSVRTPPLRMAHHVHAPAHVLAAIELRVPALVLIRDPDRAVLSLLVYRPYLTPALGYLAYERFHRPLLGHEAGFVVATFEEVTSDFGVTMRRVNERFGCDLPVFEHTPEAAARCMAEIDEHIQIVLRGKELERYVNRPSEWRRERAAALEPLLAEAPRERERAYAAYERMRSLAGA